MNNVAGSPVLRAAAVALVVSAAMAIVGQVVYVFSFPGGRASERLDLISQIATPTVGVLVLGAAILLVVRRGSADPAWLSVAVMVLGGVLALAAAYAAARLVSVHVPSPGATGQAVRVGLSSGDWSGRLGQILLRLSGGVLGAWGAWAVFTTREVSEPAAPGPLA